MYRNGNSFWGSVLPIIRITSKKGSNESCLELNFIQKSPQACLSAHEWSWGTGAPKISTFEILLCTEPGGDGHMCLLTFLDEIQFQITFI